MTRPLSARLVLLAGAVFLALSLVWAVIAAEHRDIDGQPAKPAAASEQRAPAPQQSRAVPVAVRR